METDNGQVSPDDVVDQLAKLLDRVDRGIITGREAIDSSIRTVVAYESHGTGSPDDANTVWDLCRETAEQIANHRSVLDPVLVELFDAETRSLLLGAELSERLELLLNDLRVRVEFADPTARDEIIELAGHGLATHRLLMTLSSATEKIIRTAHELKVPEALAAAVLPTSGDAHIADQRRRPSEFRLALDFLAHLAGKPDSDTGRRSIDLLLDVASSVVDRCADAAARLPLHLLDEDQRLRLLGIHEARVELFVDVDSVFVPLGLDTLRANRIVRTALWQAFDVRRIG